MFSSIHTYKKNLKTISSALAISLLVGGGATNSSNLVLAQESNLIPAAAARGEAAESVTIPVSPYGLVISFLELQESVEKFWATDYSHLRVGSDVPAGKGATLVFLKTEGKLDPNLPGTSLTVVTKTKAGETRVYSFLIELTEAKPKHTILKIYPDKVLRPKLVSTTPPVKTAASSPSPKPQVKPQVKPLSAIKPTEETPRPQNDSSAPAKKVVEEIAQASQPEPQPSPQAATTVSDKSTEPQPAPKPKGVDVPAVKSVANAAELFQTSALRSLLDKESAKTEPVKTESEKPEPIKTESAKTEPVKTESEKPEPAKTESEKPEPAKTEPAKAESGTQVAAKPAIDQNRYRSLTQANALVHGLMIANKTGEVGAKSFISQRLQNVILRLRRGESLQDACKTESIEWKTALRLLFLGNYRGSI